LGSGSFTVHESPDGFTPIFTGDCVWEEKEEAKEPDYNEDGDQLEEEQEAETRNNNYS